MGMLLDTIMHTNTMRGGCAEAQTMLWTRAECTERMHRRASCAVTTVPSKEGTQEAGKHFPECCVSIRRAVGVDRSPKEAKVGSEASLHVCCIKLGGVLVINRELIGIKEFVRGD